MSYEKLFKQLEDISVEMIKHDGYIPVQEKSFDLLIAHPRRRTNKYEPTSICPIQQGPEVSLFCQISDKSPPFSHFQF